MRLALRATSSLARRRSYADMLAPTVRVRGLASSSSADAWATLGMRPTADLDEVKDVFRRLALTLHPDISGDSASAARFAEVVSAYESIVEGDGSGAGGRRSSSRMRGVRVVGGILVVSIDELRQNPDYGVYALRLALDREGNGNSGRDGATSASTAISADTVHLVHASEWDSVGDVRRIVQEQLGLPHRLQYEHARHNEGGHELIAPGGMLLGEHLFLSDYGLRDGDLVHFAVNQRLGRRGDE